MGLERPVGGGEGAGGPGQQGPPSQALWGLVSWEAESAPSSEQKGDMRRPGARPHAPPCPGLVVLGDPSPLPSLGPHSKNQPALLSKAPGEQGCWPWTNPLASDSGKGGELPRCAGPRGAYGHIPTVPPFIPGCELGAVWGEPGHPHGVVSDGSGSRAMWLVLVSW